MMMTAQDGDRTASSSAAAAAAAAAAGRSNRVQSAAVDDEQSSEEEEDGSFATAHSQLQSPGPFSPTGSSVGSHADGSGSGGGNKGWRSGGGGQGIGVGGQGQGHGRGGSSFSLDYSAEDASEWERGTVGGGGAGAQGGLGGGGNNRRTLVVTVGCAVVVLLLAIAVLTSGNSGNGSGSGSGDDWWQKWRVGANRNHRPGSGLDGTKSRMPDDKRRYDDDDDDDHDRYHDRGHDHDQEEQQQHASTSSSSFPPLSDFVDGDKVRPNADVDWILDFSIAGFAKSGTTFLMNYLRRHNRETVIHKGEVHNLRNPDHGASDVVRMFYDYHEQDYQSSHYSSSQPLSSSSSKNNAKTPTKKKRVYGIKSPTELETEYTLHNYATYFPSTKFVISIRHPIKWFESFYNFRQYHHYPHMLPPTSTLIGECEPGYPYKPTCMTSCPSGKMDVCTVRANFHWALSRLGKTTMSSAGEKKLLGGHNMSTELPGALTGQVFLMESRQIIYGSPASQNFTKDLQRFLNLEHDLPALEPYVPPADKYAEFSNKEAVEHLIHICDAEHSDVRAALVDIGRDAADWIMGYFVKSPDVVVTAKEEFFKLLEDWGTDPCLSA